MKHNRLKKLNNEIMRDESEKSRKRALRKVYRELERTEGYKRHKLGETTFGPVYVYHQKEMFEGRPDVLLLGGLHPLCEAASVVSVIHTMRNPPDCNVSAVPLVSPWAFVAPITSEKELRRQYCNNPSSYRVGKHYENVKPLRQKKRSRAEGDMARLKQLNGRRYDLIVECHLDYHDDANSTYRPTYSPGIFASKNVGRRFERVLKRITREFKEAGVKKMDPVDMDWEAFGTEFLLKRDGKAVTFETSPNSITLFKRFIDKLLDYV